MNRDGNPGTLVPSQPGNRNAVRHGIHSKRLMAERTAEIKDELTQQFEFSPVERLAVHNLARCMAYVQTIDDYFDEHGLVTRTGKPHQLLRERARFSRELERCLAKIAVTLDRQTAKQNSESVTRADYIRELERIATGPDSNSSAHDRLTALKELMKVTKSQEPERPGSFTLQIHVREDGSKTVTSVEDEQPLLGPDEEADIEEFTEPVPATVA